MRIGVIGGSGVYDIEGIEVQETRTVETPQGQPSDAYICGRLNGVDVCFLPRHGRGHRLLPSEINHRANIIGFKMLGVDASISVSAVGSLREDDPSARHRAARPVLRPHQEIAGAHVLRRRDRCARLFRRADLSRAARVGHPGSGARR